MFNVSGNWVLPGQHPAYRWWECLGSGARGAGVRTGGAGQDDWDQRAGNTHDPSVQVYDYLYQVVRLEYSSSNSQQVPLFLVLQGVQEESSNSFVRETFLINRTLIYDHIIMENLGTRYFWSSDTNVTLCSRAVAGQTTMVNRELVDRSCASWLDTTIVQLESPLDHPSIM